MRYLALFLCIAVGVLADTLKLNNGTMVVGNIIAETDTEYIVERSLAGGTIKTKDSIRKSDVASVVRVTPEEKAAVAMKEAYDALKRYQLDPNNSYAKDYYDQVLNGSFHKFLADYPDSSHAAELRERIAAWEAERDKVASGKMKVGGRWVEAVEVGLQQVVAQAQAYATQGKFQDAIQLLQPFRNAKETAIAEEASRKAQQIQGMWQKYLDTRVRNIASEIQAWERRLQDATASTERARNSFIEWRKTNNDGMMGYKALLQQHQDAVQRGEIEQKNCEVRIAQLRDESFSTQQKLNEMQSHVEMRDMPTLHRPPPEEDLPAKLIAWAKQYWMYGLAGLVVLWLILRRR
ncbi:MAG: hypothetical protein FJ395_20190 [Verrucomicrobia bacterium]|nr:hypothetical protein [Verrucomicrobiota bacterium]